MALPYVETNGRKYMSSKKAAELLGKNQASISKCCKDGKIPPSRRFKDNHNNWYIEIDTIYPLSENEIRKILTLTLQLKNNPQYTFDWSTFTISAENIRPVYDHLLDMSYILPYQIEDSNRLPYDIVLSEKGMNLVMSTGRGNKNNPNLINSAAQWLSVALQVGQIVLQVRQSVP